jgi:hypothetical protein
MVTAPLADPVMVTDGVPVEPEPELEFELPEPQP